MEAGAGLVGPSPVADTRCECGGRASGAPVASGRVVGLGARVHANPYRKGYKGTGIPVFVWL